MFVYVFVIHIDNGATHCYIDNVPCVVCFRKLFAFLQLFVSLTLQTKYVKEELQKELLIFFLFFFAFALTMAHMWLLITRYVILYVDVANCKKFNAIED